MDVDGSVRGRHSSRMPSIVLRNRVDVLLGRRQAGVSELITNAIEFNAAFSWETVMACRPI